VDTRRGGGQGAQPVREDSAGCIAISSRYTWLRAAERLALRDCPARMRSHQLPDAEAHSRNWLARENNCGYEGRFPIPKGVGGLRLIPMARDLQFGLGGDARSNCSTNKNRRSARACTRR